MTPQRESPESDIVIARIVKARGVKGEVACSIETDFPERFAGNGTLTIQMPGGPRLTLGLESCRFHKDRVLLKFEGYDDMNAARQLVGGKIVIQQKDALPLDENEFYEYDLIGLTVELEEGVIVGKVTGLIRTGGTDVLIVKGADDREVLVPFTDEICESVNIESGRIIARPPAGLLDL